MTDFKASSFDTDFRSNPVRSKVDALLRPALLELCKHYQLQASTRMREREVKKKIVSILC